MSDVDVPGQGKLWIGNKPDLPLLIVFGGIAVTPSQMDGVKRKDEDNRPVSSDVYMWNYMNALKEKFHIFVSLPPRSVNGQTAYDAVMQVANDKHLAPSKQILYLFSGGYLPGMTLLGKKSNVDNFSAVFLVDIWMGHGKDNNNISPNFYTHFVNTNSDKVFYVYTEGGAANGDARNALVRKLGSQKATKVDEQPGDVGYMTHMRTNTVAVSELP